MKKLTKDFLNKIIKESIEDRIKMIDEAGEQAKLNRMQQEIVGIDSSIDELVQNTKQSLSNIIESISLENIISPKSILDQFKQILLETQSSINDFISSKNQLEEYVNKKGKEREKRKEIRKSNAKKTIKDGVKKDKKEK